MFSVDAEVSIHIVELLLHSRTSTMAVATTVLLCRNGKIAFCVSCIFMYLCILYMMYSCVTGERGNYFQILAIKVIHRDIYIYMSSNIDAFLSIIFLHNCLCVHRLKGQNLILIYS